MDQVMLKNPSGFGDKPLCQFHEVSFSLRLAPLFIGKIIPATLVIHSGNINLIRNQSGNTNWNKILFGENSKTLSSFEFIPKKIDIKHVNLYFNDLKNNHQSNVLDINFKIRPSLAGAINIQNQASKERLISQLNIKGNLSIKSARFKNFQITNIRTSFDDKQGLLIFSPMQANLYQGNFKGNVSANFTKTTPRYSVRGSFKDINVKNLLNDLVGYQRLLGIGQMDVDLTASSIDTAKIIPSLNGKLKFNIKNGDILGINFPSILNIGISLIKTITIIPRLVEMGKQKTTFGSMHGSAIIRNGVITNNDLYILTQDIEGNGKGKIDLVNKQIDYLFEIRPQGKTTIVRAAINGPLGNPKVQIFRQGFVPTLFQSFIPGPVRR
jgi:uncharacterized protein involved in outer membrane biogenesis